jgi:Insertion element 4 transposase N-terminal/Transposase DDE domain
MKKTQKGPPKKAQVEKTQARAARKIENQKANQDIVEKAKHAKKAKERTRRESTLSKGEADRVLDRLLLLEQVIPPGEIVQVLQDTGCLDSRSCTLSFEVLCWFVLAMGVLPEMSMRNIFKASRRLPLGKREATPHRSSLCKGRQRLGIAPIRLLFERLAVPLAKPHTPGAFYKGWRLMAMDGTVFNVPDSDANANAFGYPQGGRGAGAFPQVRKLSLVEVGTHAELALVVKGLKEKESGEQSMAPALFRHLKPSMLLLWDRGFFSYKLWQEMILRGCQVLARVKSSLLLRSTKELSDGSHLAKIYPCPSMRNRDEGGIVVRVIRYTHDDPRRVGCGEEHVMVTTLLDEVAHPARKLIVMYHERWEIELTFDEQKTHQNPWRVTKPANLRSETPLGVIQEIYTLAIGHYVTRSLMSEAAEEKGMDPDRLSFVGCFQILKTRMPECPIDPPKRERWFKALRNEMSMEVTDPRRNRINPRVIRVKMSKFGKKQPHHRGISELERSFEDVIIPRSPPQSASA